MCDYIWEAKHCSEVTYFYHSGSIPEYIPDEQKDRYLRAKEENKKLKAIGWMRKEV